MQKFITTLLTIILYSISSNSQIKSEFGIISGLVSMQSDYGERGHFGSNYSNLGYGIGGVLYLTPSNQRTRWNDRSSSVKEHLRFRAEISYMKTNLIHKGKYTENTSANTIKYNAMRGTSTIINYGMQIEYSIFSVSDKQNFDPYLSVGFLANSNTPKLESILGDFDENPELLPSVYNNGIFLEKNSSTSLIFGFGSRFRPNSWKKNTYLIDFRWQRFNSDIVEGLSPDLEANSFNDWLLFISVGYIFN